LRLKLQKIFPIFYKNREICNKNTFAFIHSHWRLNTDKLASASEQEQCS
jgi:hypothetical protein